MPTDVFINWATAKLTRRGNPTCNQRRDVERTDAVWTTDVESMQATSLWTRGVPAWTRNRRAADDSVPSTPEWWWGTGGETVPPRIVRGDYWSDHTSTGYTGQGISAEGTAQ